MKIDSTDKIISNLFNKLGPVNAFSDVLPEINALVGACIIGNFIGVSALGAMSYIALLNNIISAFSSLLGTGSLILCSRYLGAGDKSGMNKTFNTTLLVSITLGTVIAFMCFAFPAKLALGLRAPSEMVTMVSDYITGYSGYCLFVVFHLVLLRFLQIDGAAFLSSVCIFVQLSLNILLNVLNVTVFRKGMIGVGLAASISTGVSVVIEVAYFLCRGKLLHFSFKDFSFSVCKETCTLGFNQSA